VVLEAGASVGPCSSAMPSGPIRCAAVVVVPVLCVAAGVEDDVEVALALELLVALELELLLPHAAGALAARRRIRVTARRGLIRTANGTWSLVAPRWVVSCAPMSESAPTADLPMTTALELPGVRIRENLGVCYGLVVRSMGFTGGVAASFKGLRRGEIPEYTQLLEDSRRHAIDRMSENARLMGADAIVAVRFDSSEIGQQFTEIVAYGTAVKIEPLG
jgi:uncharacterized protein YbjQ (UPF0145 family)